MARREEIATEDIERVEDGEREDYLDYCAASEAIDEALETGEITSLEDFIKELGLEKDCGL
jgi:hypothetical protein